MRKSEPPNIFLPRVLKGNDAAVQFVLSLASACHLWDDLIDRDKPVSDEEVNDAFWLMLISMPTNAFFREHADSFRPLMVCAALNWQAATKFERETDPSGDDKRLLECAHVIRSDYANIVIHAAYLIGGLTWARQVTPEIRAWWMDEDFHDYLVELASERSARNKE